MKTAKESADVTTKEKLYKRIARFAEIHDDKKMLEAVIGLAKNHNDEIEAHFLEALESDPEISRIREKVKSKFKIEADSNFNVRNADKQFLSGDEIKYLWDKAYYYWDKIVKGNTVSRIYEGPDSYFDEHLRGSTAANSLRFVFPEKSRFDFIGDQMFLEIFDANTSFSKKQGYTSGIETEYLYLLKQKPHLEKQMKDILAKYEIALSEKKEE